ncbi:MAG: chorismate mutase [Lachnospiraceae bacterium]|nr:chorismate mutase [Lachnospiraceae bacterium]
MSLDGLRKQIDVIDQYLVSLYKERLLVSGRIAADKILTGKPVQDREREMEKIASVMGKGENEFERHAIAGLYEQIMAVSRKLQYRIIAENEKEEAISFTMVDKLDLENAKVVFQGAEGSYSQAAMESYFCAGIKSCHVETFKDAMEALAGGKADFAVLPWENSTAGYVTEVFDLLAQFDNYIVDEQELLIEHCLLGQKGSSLSEIEAVYSHKMSLLQAASYLGKFPGWKQNVCDNNAFAARFVSESGNNKYAAIAGEKAAEIYGLEVLATGISQSVTNTTKFIIATNQKIFRSGAGKISICFEVPHQSGSLYQMLSHFIFNDLNLNRIESRPIPERDWEYRFFADVEGNLTDSAVKNALRGLKFEAVNLKILGNY